MPATRRVVISILDLVYLAALAGIALYSLHAAHYYNLPIPTTLAAFVLGLPFIVGFLGQSLRAASFRSDGSVNQYGSWSTGVSVALIVYQAVTAALAGTYLTPTSKLRCGLEDQWRTLFRQKNEQAIRAIQDAFHCCGLNSASDQSWPFPDAHTPASTCRDQYHRSQRCLDPWRKEEQTVAGLLILVSVLVFVWQMLMLLRTAQSDSWVHALNTATDVERLVSNRPRLGYQETFSDEPGQGGNERGITEHEDEDDDQQAESRGGNNTLESRVQASRLI